MTFERTKIIKGHSYRYLVKSVRVDGKVKQVSVKYLGKVPDVETADPLEVPEKNISLSWEHFLSSRIRERSRGRK